jgi:hypothetical protein
MRIDWYTKAVLTVIAVLLGVIAAKDYLRPEGVQAQGVGLQFAGGPYNGDMSFFDPRTGDIAIYTDGHLTHKRRMTKLGEPMNKEK